MPDPKALTIKKSAAIKRVLRRPITSANRPAANAPTAQPSNIEATLNPVPTSSEPNAICKPSIVPLITPLSKPNKKPPIVATATMALISDMFNSACWSLAIVFSPQYIQRMLALTWRVFFRLASTPWVLFHFAKPNAYTAIRGVRISQRHQPSLSRITSGLVR